MPDTRSEESKIAVLETKVDNLSSVILELKGSVTTLGNKIENNYVKVEAFTALEAEVATITEKVEGLTLFKAQMIAGGAVLGFLLDYLVRWLTKN